MTTNTSLEVVGVRDAIRSLNKIEPGLRKQFTADATRIAQPAIQEVQNSYDKVPLSGMARKWEQANKKIFPFSVAKAKAGVMVPLAFDQFIKNTKAIEVLSEDAPSFTEAAVTDAH